MKNKSAPQSLSINYPVLIANYTPYITYDYVAKNVYLDLVFPGCD